ncbi:YlxR family protein [Arthrobacter sp. Br18]|uniref:YlxR family protein n=1 Tax=Arthrobacter sp. Br18 TaxID=1312954 RepID=UPI0009E0AB68|nr:YlxR family protein [Arthrobacter sp. Br18]
MIWTESVTHSGRSTGSTADAHPVRTCVGCRKRADQSHLVRVVTQDIDGKLSVVFDEHRRLSGRGAWLHPEPACMESAIKRKAFNRAFRGAVEIETLVLRFHTHPAAPRSGRSNPPSFPESGSEN